MLQFLTILLAKILLVSKGKALEASPTEAAARLAAELATINKTNSLQVIVSTVAECDTSKPTDHSECLLILVPRREGGIVRAYSWENYRVFMKVVD